MAESAEAAQLFLRGCQVFLRGCQAVLSCRERVLALPPAAVEHASRHVARVWPSLRKCHSLGCRALERSGETSGWIAFVDRAAVVVGFERMADEVEAGLEPRSGAGDVAPFAEGALVAQKQEGAIDGRSLGGVAGERVAVLEWFEPSTAHFSDIAQAATVTTR